MAFFFAAWGVARGLFSTQVVVRMPDDGVLGVRCAITLDVMQDPVVAADGETYERAAIAVRGA